jgi:hypothetical protein
MSGVLIWLAMVAAALVVAQRLSARRWRKMQDLAAHLGLGFEGYFLGARETPGHSFGGRPSRRGRADGSSWLRLLPMTRTCVVRGQANGVDVEIGPAPYRSSRKSNDTGVSAWFRQPLGFGLHIAEENFIDRLGRVAGAQDIKSGNESFDRRFVVKGTSESEVLSLVRRPDVQQAIVDAFAAGFQTVIDDKGVHITLPGFRSDPQEIRPVLEVVTRTARVLDGAVPPRSGTRAPA